jgi:TRAP-type mannitol/chloroaromatic compound transport system permease small subunit
MNFLLRFLLRFARAIDALNRMVGRATYWLILIAVLISSFNAIARKTLDMSSNAMLEIQWYLFAAIFLLCAGYTLLNNEHVRVDVLFGRMSRRKQLVVEIFGILFFLTPMTLLVLVLSWAPFTDAWVSGEVSSNAGGLIRWPVKLLIPVGFALLMLQGLSELIKNIHDYRQLGAAPAGGNSASSAAAGAVHVSNEKRS